jgi:hypothetical protein
MKNYNFNTYLVGPIDRVDIEEAQRWRVWLTEKLNSIGIGALNPFGKMGGDRLGNVRNDLNDWNVNGEIDKIRNLVGNIIIPPDLKMVEQSTFVTVYIPNKSSEICGSYGEATVAKYLGIPVYVVTDRCLVPNTLPNWLIGCSEAIFSNWEDYIKYVFLTWVF